MAQCELRHREFIPRRIEWLLHARWWFDSCWHLVVDYKSRGLCILLDIVRAARASRTTACGRCYDRQLFVENVAQTMEATRGVLQLLCLRNGHARPHILTWNGWRIESYFFYFSEAGCDRMVSLSVQRVEVGVRIDTYSHLCRFLDALELLLLSSWSLWLIVWCSQHACILKASLVHWRSWIWLQCVRTWHSNYLLVHVHGLPSNFVDLSRQGRLIAISYRVRGWGEVDARIFVGASTTGYLFKKNLRPPVPCYWLSWRGDWRLRDLSAYVAIVYCRLLACLDALNILHDLLRNGYSLLWHYYNV